MHTKICLKSDLQLSLPFELNLLVNEKHKIIVAGLLFNVQETT